MKSEKLKKFLRPYINITEGKSEEEIQEVLKSEMGQSRIRFLVAAIIFVWASYTLIFKDNTPELTQYWIWIFFCGFYEVLNTLPILILIKTGRIKTISGMRIIYGMVADTLALLVGMYVSEVYQVYEVAPYYMNVFTMLILGNGLRYGFHFLLVSAVLSIVALGWVCYTFPFWTNNEIITNAFYINMLVVAVYTVALVRRLGQVQENLVASQKAKVNALKEVGNLKSQFFANISHEFRTPIAITLATVETLLSGKFLKISNEMKSKLQPVKRNQKRLLSLINQLLDIEKLEQGKFNLKVQKLQNPSEFLGLRLDQFNELANKKNLSLENKVDNALENFEIYCDVEMLDKAIFNLLSNAVKFTAAGSVTMTATVEDGNLHIKLKDTGIGIKEDEVDKVFERFRQAHGSESKDFAGTGIGLALVREVAEAHKGQVSVTSEYGRGSCFELKLPTGKDHFDADRILEDHYADSDDLQLESAVAKAEGKENIEGINKTIAWNKELSLDKSKPTLLFVEDNGDLRNFVKENLEDKYNIYLGYDGEHGFEMASQVRPDIIISDQMMPNLTGTGLLKKIRSSNELRKTPFIILTANVNPESKMESLKMGADDFLYKPFYIEEVTVRIDNLLTLREQQLQLEKDLTSAREIQQSLLPEIDESTQEGFQLSTMYKPCDKLSGDFFDIHNSDDHVVFYLADVTSHGVASAQVTYLVKSTFSAVLKEHGFSSSPSTLLKLFTKEFLNNKIDYGVAMQVCRFNKKTGELEIAHSSSPPAILFSKDRTDFLAPESAPYIHPSLQADNYNTGADQQLKLQKGDVFLCYTDGALELNTDKGQGLSYKRFASAIKSSATSTQWKEPMLETLSSLNGGNAFDDDVSLLRLEVLNDL